MRTFILIIVILFTPFCSTNAQESSALQGGIRYGVSGNVGVNLHNVRFLSLPGGIRETIDNGVANLDYSYVSGTGLHFHGGVFAEFPLLSWLNLGVHLNFYDKSGLLESAIIRTPAGRADGTETLLRSSRKMDVTLQNVGPEVIFGITPIQGFNIYAGFRGDIAFQKAYFQREEMTDETDGTFENGLRVRNEVRGELPEVRNLGIANFNAALTGGFGLEFAFGNNRALSLELRVLGDFGAFHVMQRMDRPDEWWRVNSLKAGLALRYYPEREKDLSEIESRLQRIQALEKAVVSERTKIQEELKELKQSGLSANITRIVGKTFSGKTVENPRITLEKAQLIRIVEWQPALIFPDNSGIIPARYKRLQAQETSRFSEEQLTRQPPNAVSAQTLNILGKRLAESSSASISLVYFTTQGNSPTNDISVLSSSRISAVREYLRAVWAVAPERVQGKEERVSTRNYSPEALQKLVSTVQFRAYDDGSKRIFRPLQSESVGIIADISSLTMSLDIRSGQGLKEWTMELTQFEDREIRTLGLFKGSKDFPREIQWDIREENGSLPSVGNPVTIKLEATDMANRSIDAVPVEISVDAPPTAQRSPRYRLEKRTLAVEDTPESALVLERSKLLPDAQVRIISPSERLAPRVQSQVAAALGISPNNITVLLAEPSQAALGDERASQPQAVSVEILEKIKD
ncbi:MAG: hypothetical protein MUF71_00580 [Candidatus Kapabacteria bacterium]|jgi:hypothetical protein|nr:hypothetical protein [Candidatus Kapabacteria bacterium]